MLLAIILKDLKEGAEELTCGLTAYPLVMDINFGYEILNKSMSILIPLFSAYLVHKLKTNYWQPRRSFIKYFIEDIKKWYKNK